MIPFPAGITSMLAKARFVQSMKWKRSSLRRSSMAAVLLEGVRVEPAALHGQRMVHDELHRHHRVHLRRVAAFGRDGIAQAGQVDQRGLAQDVVAHHAHRKPRKVAIAPALDELQQAFVEDAPGRSGAPGSRRARARCRAAWPRRRAQRVDRGAGVDVVQRGAGEVLAVFVVHGASRLPRGKRGGFCLFCLAFYVRSWIGANARSSGPV
jgi:hypothetical protein